MKVVAIIPARGGSKGIPQKNLQYVGPFTLVQHAIFQAKAIDPVEGELVDVIVTSDSKEILEHANLHKVSCVKRPERLATDLAPTDDAVIHALKVRGHDKNVGDDDLTVLLQPTSPFRTQSIINGAIDHLWAGHYDSVFTACEGHFSWRLFHTPWNPYKDSNHLSPEAVPVSHQRSRMMRQQIPLNQRVFHENGAVYVTKTKKLLELKSRIVGRTGIYVMDPEDSIDIDTEYDLWLANQRHRYLSEQMSRQKAS